MPDKFKKALVGAIIALALGFAVSYGLIDKQTADKIQTRTDETLAEEKPAQQPAPTPQQPAPAPAPQAPEPQTPAPAPAPAEPAPQLAPPAPGR